MAEAAAGGQQRQQQQQKPEMSQRLATPSTWPQNNSQQHLKVSDGCVWWHSTNMRNLTQKSKSIRSVNTRAAAAAAAAATTSRTLPVVPAFPGPKKQAPPLYIENIGNR